MLKTIENIKYYFELLTYPVENCVYTEDYSNEDLGINLSKYSIAQFEVEDDYYKNSLTNTVAIQQADLFTEPIEDFHKDEAYIEYLRSTLFSKKWTKSFCDVVKDSFETVTYHISKISSRLHFNIFDFDISRAVSLVYSSLIKVKIKLYVYLRYNPAFNHYLKQHLLTISFLIHKVQSEFSLLDSSKNNYFNKLKNNELNEKSKEYKVCFAQ